MIRINQLKLKITHDEQEISAAVCKTLRISPKELLRYNIIKRSIDARKKDNIVYSYVIDVEVPASNEKAVLNRNKNNRDISASDEVKYVFPYENIYDKKSSLSIRRPVIIGSGPAGMFCGFMLAEAGFRPIILERGECVDKRMESVEAFWRGEKLNPESNVQFGEGGAGTFSDGKLNTLVKDAFGRNKKVLEIFAEMGAPKEILYVNKPHIGTDILCKVVKNIRNRIESLGGEVRFESKVTDFLTDNGKIRGVVINDTEVLEADAVVLAVGHSARDTFKVLYEKGIDMEQKAFAVGIRVQHPQEMINVSQYGKASLKSGGTQEKPALPPADYKLTYKAADGRGVYSFCMCPGGFVVNASSEEGRLAINGMSYSDRAGKNANSAIIVTVRPEDFGSGDPLFGVEFQRRLEENAYKAADGKIPFMYLGEFLKGKELENEACVIPQFKGAAKHCMPTENIMRKILPDYVCNALAEAFAYFGQKIKGFDREDAIIAAVESRTSSPLRINRDENFESNIKGLYPCGEGAGYAGGITSAAMDGIRIAEAIVTLQK